MCLKKYIFMLKCIVGDTMKSRMDRYYESNETGSRVSKNKKFYDNSYSGDYDLKSYSNIEGVARIESNNEIDLNKLQALLKRREEERQNEMPHLVKRNVETYNPSYEDEEKNYDINEILSQAKTEKKDDYKMRNLSDTSYNVLRNINIKEVEDEDAELKELINTVTSTNLINKLGDKDLSLDLLNDLKSNNNTDIISPSDMKEAIKNQNSSTEENDDIKNIDKSFYTSSLGFSSDDFEQLKDIHDSIKTNNKLIKFLVLILVIAIIAGIIFLIYNLKG